MNQKEWKEEKKKTTSIHQMMVARRMAVGENEILAYHKIIKH